MLVFFSFLVLAMQQVACIAFVSQEKCFTTERSDITAPQLLQKREERTKQTEALPVDGVIKDVVELAGQSVMPQAGFSKNYQRSYAGQGKGYSGSRPARGNGKSGYSHRRRRSYAGHGKGHFGSRPAPALPRRRSSVPGKGSQLLQKREEREKQKEALPVDGVIKDVVEL